MEFKHEKNRIFLENDQKETIAEVTFPTINEDVVDINHTFVDDSLRGQGIAGKLMVEVANRLRKENKKVVPTCPYAVNWFKKNTEYQDVLADKT